MEIRADFLELAQRVGIDLAEHVTARDDLYLRPAGLTRAAARRFRTGLKYLAAYLRRLILLLALQMEHCLAERAPVPIREKRSKWPSIRGFRVLDTNENWPGEIENDGGRLVCPLRTGALVPSASLFSELDTMLALLKAPEARAKRLAWHLARRVRFAGVPAFGAVLRLRLATEAQVIFAAMARVIQTAGGARPPSLGPAPRPPPRIRGL